MDMLSYMMGRANGGGGGGNPLGDKALLTAIPGSKAFHYQIKGTETPITEATGTAVVQIIGHVDGYASVVDLVSGTVISSRVQVGPEQQPGFRVGGGGMAQFKYGMVIAVNVE